MVVADTLVVHHVFEVADDFGGTHIAASGRNERLVHVERNGAGAVYGSEINAAFLYKNRFVLSGLYGLLNNFFGPRNVRYSVDIFLELRHNNISLNMLLTERSRSERSRANVPFGFAQGTMIRNIVPIGCRLATNTIIDLQIFLSGQIP